MFANTRTKFAKYPAGASLCALFVWACLVSFSSRASTFLAMDQEALILGSDAVVHGQVIQVESYWDETGSIIFTEAMVQVEDQLVGRPTTVVVVRTPGGEVDGFVVEAHGFPTFSRDQEVVVFLKKEGEHNRVTGHQLGLYRVQRRAAGQAVVAEGQLGTEVMAVPAFDGGARLLNMENEEIAPPAAQSLGEFKQSIRDDARRLGKATD